MPDADRPGGSPLSTSLGAGQGRLRRVDVDPTDDQAFVRWVSARARAFHEPDIESESDLERFASSRQRMLRAVLDDSEEHSETPVGTLSAWDLGVRLPGAPGQSTRTVSARAISAVSVAPTHRRRGIARSLIVDELRDARRSGLALAVLTATEAAIYGRFGFGPATHGTDCALDVRRARWLGDSPPGRVRLVPRDELRSLAPALDDEAHARVAGEVVRWGNFYDRMLGLTPDRKRGAASLRAVRYDDEAGHPRGYALYRVRRSTTQPHVMEAAVVDLVAATPDAYAALWRFLGELDLVDRVVASLRDDDEPLRWMLEDPAAVVTSNERALLWMRVLDVPSALAARGWAAAGTVVLDVRDPLGLAAGVFRLTTDTNGEAHVTDVTEAGAQSDESTLTLDVAELGALLLGGVRTETLERARRVRADDPSAAAQFDRMLASERTPRLSSLF